MALQSTSMAPALVTKSMAIKESTPLVAKRSFSTLALVRVLTSVTSIAEGYDMSCIAGVALNVSSKWELATWQLSVLISVGHGMVGMGALLGGCVSDTYGRHGALASSYAILIVGSLSMAMATDITELIMGRMIQTIGVGFGLGVVTTYCAEMAPRDLRGTFPSFEEAFLVMGVVFGNAANELLLEVPDGWRYVLGFGGVLPALMLVFLGMGLLPESPRFLAMHGRVPEATAVLNMLVDPDEARDVLNHWKTETRDVATWSEVLFPETARGRRALIIGVGILFCQQGSGIVAVTLYTPTILAAELSKSAAMAATLLFAVVRCIVCILIVFLVDSVGRRSLLLCSAVGCTLAMGALSATWTLGLAVVPWKIFALLAFGIAFSIGFGPVAYVVASEVFPTHVRSKSTAVAFVVGRGYSFFLLLSYPFAAEAVGTGACFAFSTVTNVLLLLFVYMAVPETSCVALEKMHTIFESEEEDASATI